jgi:hypothetical protein
VAIESSIQMGAHTQMHVRWEDIVVAPLMSVLRPLESVPETTSVTPKS